MRKYLYLAFDVASIGAMLLASLYLRNGWMLIEDAQPNDLTILLLCSLLTALCVLPLLNTHKRLWRYTSSADISAVIIAATLIVLLTNGGLFLFNRLEIVPRSVPPMHWALTVTMLCGARLFVRHHFGPKLYSGRLEQRKHVLLLGTGHVAELYLDFIKRVVPGQIVVEGLIDENHALHKRSFHQHEIVGTPDTLEQVVEQFMVHGIRISQIVLAQPFETLSANSKRFVLELEHKHNIELVHFQKQIGISEEMLDSDHCEAEELAKVNRFKQQYPLPRPSYASYKRLIDVVGAVILLCLLAPFMLLASLLVWLDIGSPMLFWQQRPGRYGRPFRLYKFRTMRPARRALNQDRLAHKTTDAKRTTFIGHWLRRLRLDELPQLIHILDGSMSFIGPRPLLPDDQPEGGEARLCIRPGITGWAQVHGGDALTAEQKLVLDLWYIQNMSFWLDMRIIIKTLHVACTGDKANSEQMINQARQTLRAPFTIHESLNSGKTV